MQEVVNRSPRPAVKSLNRPPPPPPAGKKKSSFWDSLFGSKKALSADVGNVCGTLAVLQRDGSWVTRFFMFNSSDKRLLWSEDEKQGSNFLGVLPLNSIVGVGVHDVPERPFTFKIECVDPSLSLILGAPDNGTFQAWIHLISKLC